MGAVSKRRANSNKGALSHPGNTASGQTEYSASQPDPDAIQTQLSRQAELE